MTQAADWRPSADISTLQRRAQLLADIRQFFSVREVLEVETPILSAAAPTAPYLDSFVSYYADQQPRYLHTSPEFAMKRLLAAGSGSIYQTASVFRNGEAGHQHAPEFTMLEWYRLDFDIAMLIDEVDQFMQSIAGQPAAARLSYQSLFENYLQLDCFTCSEQALKQTAIARIPALPADWQSDRDGWLQLLLSELIEPQLKQLDKPLFITDFPASQAQLAKVQRNSAGQMVAARFELYAGGMELANGYDELLDAAELAQRFERDNATRRQQGKATMPVDKHLLAAMTAGLPQCAGVALGLDRLMMLICGINSIEQTRSFSFHSS